VCVTTNQAGVAYGFYPEQFVHEVHAYLTESLAAGGAHVDGWFYCPHHVEARVERLRVACDCRKPAPGMIRQAAAAMPIDLARSFVVGDKLADLGLARNAGTRGVLVRTGYGDEVARQHGGRVPDAANVADDLMAATAWILQESGHPRHER
jgi:D-glycero-D-manno-heptose 1,7-bisphosphate phosphatase